MKKLFFIFVMLVGSLQAYSQAAKLIASQAKPAQNINTENLLYVDTTDMRIWAVNKNSIKINPVQVTWINDSMIVIGDKRWVKLAGNYPNPSFISSIAANKVTGLSTVAISNNYNDLSNKPVIPAAQVNSDWNSSTGVSQVLNKPDLSVYETISHASATYYPNTNPSGFISSYTETDPTVPSYAKSLTSFNIIKASTDALYKAIGYVPSNSEVLSAIGYTPYNGTINPLGFITSVPAQSFASLTGKPTTLSGYGITDAVPSTRTITINGTAQDLSANRSYTIDKASVGLGNVDNTSDANKPLSSAATTALNGKQATLVSGTNIKTVGGTTLLGSGDIALPAYTSGTGISIASNVITNTAPDQTVTLTGSNGITTSGTYPNFAIQQTTPTYNNAPARTLGTSFRPSATRPTRVSYTVSITTAISLLNLNSAGSVQLQISSDNVNFTTINSAGISRTLAVSISIGLNETTMFNIQGEIPAGFYCKLLSTVSGGATSAFTSGQETTY